MKKLLNNLIEKIERHQFEWLKEEGEDPDLHYEGFKEWKQSQGMIFSYLGEKGLLITVDKWHSPLSGADFFHFNISVDSLFVQVGPAAATIPF